MTNPLLSVCVPTYNRAEWLRSSLFALAAQTARSNGLVELVVSDNHSEDHTPEVVTWASQYGPIRYHRNRANVGGMKNVHGLVNDLARGEFIWILGDDDLVVKDALQRIIEPLQKHPELDYVYVNYAYWQPAAAPTQLISADDLLATASLGNSDTASRYVARLRELVAGDPSCFTPFYCSVLRRSLARRVYEPCAASHSWASLETAVPQATFIARHSLDEPAWYVGRPCVVASLATAWSHYLPAFLLVMMPELYGRFQLAGVGRSVMDAHRRKILGYQVTAQCLIHMLTERDVPHRDRFSLRRFIWENRRFRELWLLLLRAGQQFIRDKLLALPEPAPKVVKWVWNKRRRLSPLPLRKA